MPESKKIKIEANADDSAIEIMKLNDEDLLNLSVKDLNKAFKTIPHDHRMQIKRRRRILKNRGYAANCRNKRMSEKDILQMKKDDLIREVAEMTHQNEILKLNLKSINERIEDLENYALAVKNKKLISAE
jgi:transcription factor MAFF/G/K